MLAKEIPSIVNYRRFDYDKELKTSKLRQCTYYKLGHRCFLPFPTDILMIVLQSFVRITN